MDRLFLDANVLFTAAHRPQGKAAFLAEALRSKPSAPWQLLTSAHAIEEAHRNLAAKFPASAQTLSNLLAVVQLVPQPPTPSLSLDVPAKDIPIWAAALAANATHLITADLRDFGQHMNRPAATGGVVIQTVADYLASQMHPDRL